MESTEDGLLDIYEEKYDSWGEDQPVRHGGSGRKHSDRTKSQLFQSKIDTELRIKSEQEKSERFITEYIENTWKDLDPTKKLEKIKSYVEWLKNSADQKIDAENFGPVRIKSKLPELHSGGQNAQKNKTTVVFTHIPTKIRVEAGETRSLETNKITATEKLKDKLKSHLRIWKSTSPEFKKRFIAQQVESQPNENSYTPLPIGVSIGNIREQLPPTVELVIKFGWEGDSDGKPKIAEIGNEKFPIFPNTDYRINNNPQYGGDVFMNPIKADTGAPKVSDIPRALDMYIASQEGRSKSGITVSIRNINSKIEKIIKIDLDTHNISEAYDKLRSFSSKYRETELRKSMESIEELLNLDKYEKGSRAYDLIYNDVWLMVESMYIGSDNRDALDLKTLTEDSMLYIMQEIRQIVDRRPNELKNMNLPDGGRAIQIDTIPIDHNEPDYGLKVLTTYIPKRGWTVTIPVGSCPNLASFMIDQFGQKKLDPAENKIFFESTQKAIENGRLKFSSDGKTIVFYDVGSLDPQMAIFEGGNDTIKAALETLRVAGDPLMGEQVFNFIVYKKDEVEYQILPPIDLTI